MNTDKTLDVGFKHVDVFEKRNSTYGTMEYYHIIMRLINRMHLLNYIVYGHNELPEVGLVWVPHVRPECSCSLYLRKVREGRRRKRKRASSKDCTIWSLSHGRTLGSHVGLSLRSGEMLRASPTGFQFPDSRLYKVRLTRF